ncbi:MAG TPA: cytochrome c [Candidatus Cybelea sp.]|nr:cytochrome c [Candidatus Cybelea sp.]
MHRLAVVLVAAFSVGGVLAIAGWQAYAAEDPAAASNASAVWSGGDAARGKQIFAANGCGWCHENTGRKAGRGPQLMNTPQTDAFIADRIRHGKTGRMPAFGGSFKDDQIKDLIAFIRNIKPEGTQ